MQIEGQSDEFEIKDSREKGEGDENYDIGEGFNFCSGVGSGVLAARNNACASGRLA
jgi:hypothetical protein